MDPNNLSWAYAQSTNLRLNISSQNQSQANVPKPIPNTQMIRVSFNIQMSCLINKDVTYNLTCLVTQKFLEAPDFQRPGAVAPSAPPKGRPCFQLQFFAQESRFLFGSLVGSDIIRVCLFRSHPQSSSIAERLDDKTGTVHCNFASCTVHATQDEIEGWPKSTYYLHKTPLGTYILMDASRRVRPSISHASKDA